MNWIHSLEILADELFWLIACTLTVWISISIYKLRKKNTRAWQRHLEHWDQITPKWVRSKIIGVALTTGFIWLGISTAIATYHWQVNKNVVLRQILLPLDLHIPKVLPNQTYKVTAKFYVDGRGPYQSSSPLSIQFGPQKPVYRVMLYYDPKKPTRNEWTRFQPPGPQDLNRAMNRAIGFMILAAMFLKWLEIEWIRRRVARVGKHRRTVAGNGLDPVKEQSQKI